MITTSNKKIGTRKRELTTVNISPVTKERLGRVGNKNQTFDEVVNQLIDTWEEVQQSKK